MKQFPYYQQALMMVVTSWDSHKPTEYFWQKPKIGLEHSTTAIVAKGELGTPVPLYDQVHCIPLASEVPQTLQPGLGLHCPCWCYPLYFSNHILLEMKHLDYSNISGNNYL